MAQLYTIKCPKCGERFSIAKGVLMSWDFTRPIPEDLRDETPFNCPKCNHTMSVLDDDLKYAMRHIEFPPPFPEHDELLSSLS